MLPACRHGLANPLVFMNAREIGDAAYARWLHWCNAAQDESLPPVLLGRYPAGTLLDGEGSFQVFVDGVRVAEQPLFPADSLADTLALLHQRAETAIAVDRPCLLVCRYGEWTWGHWLLDMLPKIVMAERVAPQRFTYAVPAGIVDPAEGGAYSASVLDSLAAYGIAPSRLLRVRPGAVYRCAALFDVAGISGKHLHPGVLAALRALPGPSAPGLDTLAVLRGPPSIRCLSNTPDIRRALIETGTAFLDPLASGFRAQVAAFRSADMVVGDLGSNLAAVIYARPGTGLVTLAPTGWQDDYFARLFQRLGVLQADVRGHALPEPGQPFHHAPVVVNPADMLAGLASVRRAMAEPRMAARVVDGRVVAPSLGRVLAEITFGTDGNATPHLRAGFAAPERTGTWSLGEACRLAMTCPPVDGPVWLEIEAVGLVHPPFLVARPVVVSVNGNRLAEYDVDGQVHVHVSMPWSADLEITIHHAVHPSPKALGLSQDNRQLGIMLRRIAIRANR